MIQFDAAVLDNSHISQNHIPESDKDYNNTVKIQLAHSPIYNTINHDSIHPQPHTNTSSEEGAVKFTEEGLACCCVDLKLLLKLGSFGYRLLEAPLCGGELGRGLLDRCACPLDGGTVL